MNSAGVYLSAVALILFHVALLTPARGAVVAWGYNGYGQTNVPSDLENVVAVSGGGGHNLVLKRDGTVVAWGDNTYHQTNVPAGLSNIVAVSAGTSHSLALRADGVIVGWGDNWAGQTNAPTDLGQVVAISAGGSHSLALRANGTVVAWGANSNGQTNVPSNLRNVVSIAAGGSHSLALQADGTVLAWGDDFYGQSRVPPGLSNVVAIQAGSSHSLAMTADGKVVAWGMNAWGQGTVPTEIQPASAIAAGAGHNLALQPGGTVFAWGLNYDGETQTPPDLTNVVAVDAGDFHSIALSGEGSPFLSSMVTDRTAPLGGTAIFYAEVTGANPLSYQWKFDGTNLPGATQAALVLTNLQVSQAGFYRVVVTNQFGATGSSEAVLTLVENRSCTNVLPGMLAWWAGENNGHDQVGGLEAAAAQGVTYQPGESGNAFEFHGTNQHLIVADAPALNPTNGFTVEAWVYPSLAPHSWATILSKADGTPTQQYELHLIKTSDGQAVLYGLVGTWDGVKFIQGTNEIPLNTWTHVAMTYDLTNLCLYVNGRLDTRRTEVSQMRLTAAPLYIGGGPYFLFDGRIDELSIYDRAVSATELQGIYNAGSAGKCALRLPPSIVSQPEPVTVPIGGDAVFTVSAQSADSTDLLTFQWLRDDASLPGMTNATLSLHNVQLSDAGSYSVVVIGSGGKVASAPAMLSVEGIVAWGVPDDEQTAVPLGLTDVVAIAAGGLQNMALRADGTVLVAGANGFGQTNVPPGLSNVVAIASGSQHCLALKRDESIVAWGNNMSAQTLVPAGLTNVAAIAAGPWHSLALRIDGRVFSWGFGQTNVPANLTNVIAIAADLDHSLALRADGTLCAWGDNYAGQNDIPAGLGPVVAIACGTAHNMALLADGTVAAWGAQKNDYGQTDVPPGLSNVVAIAAGEYHSLALKSDGTVVAWGAPWGGITDIPTGLKNVMAISASLEHSLALVGNGSPFLTAPLINRTASEGGTTVFRAATTGTQPMTYQWIHSGVLLSGETRASLVLTNLQMDQGGVYSVVVSNAVGGVISFGAELRVLPGNSCFRAPAGLVAWWRGESTTRDECSGIFGFVPLGQVFFGPGEAGVGFAFNGSGAGVCVGNLPEFQISDLTIEGWIRRSSTSTVSLSGAGSWAHIFGYDTGGYRLSLNATGRPLFGAEQGGIGPIYEITDTNIHHLAVTKSGADINFYVDGEDVGATSLDPTFTFAGSAWIGGLGTENGFYGSVDELSVYSRALGGEEVRSIYNAGKFGKCLSPLPPLIQMQPTNQTVSVGSSVWLPVFATGTEPLSYQWYFNGASLPWARQNPLLLTNIQPSQAGTYYVVVSNDAGAVVSSSAQITVVGPWTSVVQAVGGAFDSGTTIRVRLEFVANGTENAFAGSLNFSPEMLHYLDVQPGSGAATATLMMNTNQTRNGMLGIGLALPGGRSFPPGTQQVASVSFFVPTVEKRCQTFLTFGDSPAKRQVVDTNAAIIPAAFIGGTLVIAPPGYEGDVASCPHGDGEVTVADWAQLGRFAAGLDTPVDSNEFRRADCAPRNTLGDGVIGLADWVQAGRYAIGLDSVVTAGGPDSGMSSGALPVLYPASRHLSKAGTRAVIVSQTTAAPNEPATVVVNLKSLGNEEAVAFSLSFDPAALKFESAALGQHASSAQMNINAKDAASGRVGLVLALPPGSTVFSSGLQEAVRVTFRPQPSAAGECRVELSDQPVAREVCDDAALPLPADYVAGLITVDPRPRLRVARRGDFLTLSWPQWATNATLQECADPSRLNSPWTDVPATPAATNGTWTITVPHNGGIRFYRLMNR